MEYQILYEPYPEQLAIQVNRALNNGWTPLGSPVIIYVGDYVDNYTRHADVRFYQAIIRESED